MNKFCKYYILIAIRVFCKYESKCFTSLREGQEMFRWQSEWDKKKNV